MKNLTFPRALLLVEKNWWSRLSHGASHNQLYTLKPKSPIWEGIYKEKYKIQKAVKKS